MAPAIISPIRWGIFNLLSTIGAKRMINRMVENIRTGLLSGSEKSVILRKVSGMIGEKYQEVGKVLGKDNREKRFLRFTAKFFVLFCNLPL